MKGRPRDERLIFTCPVCRADYREGTYETHRRESAKHRAALAAGRKEPEA